MTMNSNFRTILEDLPNPLSEDLIEALWAHWGLVITSIYLICAGAAQQLIPLAED